MHFNSVWIARSTFTSASAFFFFSFFLDQRLLHCSWDMNSALRQSYSNPAMNSNSEIIFLLFSVFNFQQNKWYPNAHLGDVWILRFLHCVFCVFFFFPGRVWHCSLSMNSDFRLINSVKRVNSNFFIFLFLLFSIFNKISGIQTDP